MSSVLLFLLRVAISPFVLALVVTMAWIYSFMMAAVAICEAGSKTSPVSTAMAGDLERFLNRILVLMGLS